MMPGNSPERWCACVLSALAAAAAAAALLAFLCEEDEEEEAVEESEAGRVKPLVMLERLSFSLRRE